MTEQSHEPSSTTTSTPQHITTITEYRFLIQGSRNRRKRSNRKAVNKRVSPRRMQSREMPSSVFFLLLVVCCIGAGKGFLYPHGTLSLAFQWRKKNAVVSFGSGDSNFVGNNDDNNEKKQKKVPTPVELDLMHRMSQMEANLLQRISQLEQLVASQQVQIQHLTEKGEKLIEMTESLGELVASLQSANKKGQSDTKRVTPAEPKITKSSTTTFEDTAGIFSSAPATVLEAADAAGAAVLAGLLAGQQRLLVDVRDAELCSDAETLVQFIELAVLPVAAGLEGLRSQRNRLKIVLPTISDLLTYRRHMALSAPEVVALSTLGLDPVEQKDNLVVIVVPSPDDSEGLDAMNALLSQPSLNQPVLVLNHHMVPTEGMAAKFEVAYHLRLLTVQYMSGDDPPIIPQNATSKDAQLEAVLQHAQQTGVHSGTTRAMVIRAYPRPWHVFVDTSPDTDADFSVAATFDSAPESEEIHKAIVECLEGSEEEDEIVAQQMQIALELGQLDKISDMLWSMGLEDFDDDEEEDSDEEDDLYRDMFGEDSV